MGRLRWLAGLLTAASLGACAQTAPPAAIQNARCSAPPRVAAAPTAAPGMGVLLHEDFANPTASSLHQRAMRHVDYTFEGGAYRIAVEQPGLLAWSLFEPIYTNAIIEAEAALIAGAPTSASSLLFRYHDADNFYLFSVAHNGYYRLERLTNGTSTVLIDWTYSDAIVRLPTATPAPNTPPPAHNTLRVELRDNYIALAVNGTPLDHTLDDTVRAGKVALAANTSPHGPAVICFRRLTITAAEPE